MTPNPNVPYIVKHLSRLGIAVVVFLTATTISPAPAPCAVTAQESPAIVRNDRLGLAHVDVMDLHIVRRPDAPPLAVEPLGGADITNRYDRAVASSATWHRWSMYWDLIDRGGKFSWAVTDGIVARDVSREMRTLAVLQGMPPGVRHLEGAPAGIYAPIFRAAGGSLTDDPAAATAINPDNTWARFVAAAVDRYRPGGSLAKARGWPADAGVTHWEIGNEPNLRHFWRGTPAEFARFLEVAYLAAKWHDPDAVIVHGGMANDANAGPWYEQFADALKARAAVSSLPARHGFYFDKAGWHWYTQMPYLTVGPARARSILTERGIPAKPIWVTEFGAPIKSEYPGPCWDPASPGRVTTAEQSAYVWQSVAEGLASGVDVMIYFQLFDDCGNGIESYDAFGLVRNHAANQCWAAPVNKGCWQFDPQAAGTTRPVTISWNTTGRDRAVEIPAVAQHATLFELDASGAVLTRSVESGAGRYRVLLPGATNRAGHQGRSLTAGRPVILVEGTGFAAPAAARGVTDRTPPYIAVVGALPELSQPRLDLTILAADETSPLAAMQVFYSIGSPPKDPSGWVPVGAVLPWPGAPQMGKVTLPFVGAPGLAYFFAAQAADAFGNWTALPPYAQAFTRIARIEAEGSVPRSTAEPTAGRRTPSAQ
jgi:hypothetical protein